MRTIPCRAHCEKAGPPDPDMPSDHTDTLLPALAPSAWLGLDLRADEAGRAPDPETTRQALDCMLSAAGADREVSVVLRMGRLHPGPAPAGTCLGVDAGEIAETVASLVPFARQSAAERGKTVALSLAVDEGTDGGALAEVCQRWDLELLDARAVHP